MLYLSAVEAQQPTIKGGLDNFVANHIIYPSYAQQHCIQGTIKVSFKLNDNGEVKDPIVENGLGVDLDEEALRIIKMTNRKWILPAQQDTTLRYIVPIKFSLEGYQCERKSKAEIARYIQGYKDLKDLEELVSNYYQQKAIGTARSESEPRILRIKEDLGIDEDYLDSRIELALKKIKQGDKEGACKDFNFVKNMGSDKANDYLVKYCY